MMALINDRRTTYDGTPETADTDGSCETADTDAKSEETNAEFRSEMQRLVDQMKQDQGDKRQNQEGGEGQTVLLIIAAVLTFVALFAGPKDRKNKLNEYLKLACVALCLAITSAFVVETSKPLLAFKLLT